jgi:hypothetical protein
MFFYVVTKRFCADYEIKFQNSKVFLTFPVRELNGVADSKLFERRGDGCKGSMAIEGYYRKTRGSAELRLETLGI